MIKGVEKLKKQAKAKELTKTILSVCAAGGGVCVLAGFSPQSSAKLGKAVLHYSNWRVKQCLKRLSLQNYIKYNEDDLDKPIYITKKGLQRYKAQSLKDKIKLFKFKKWDHLWRLVTFDVKETYRYKRDALRRQLLSLGFYKLQKNIFVIPFPIENDLEEIIASHRLWNYVLVLQVADLGKHEERVRNFFLKK